MSETENMQPRLFKPPEGESPAPKPRDKGAPRLLSAERHQMRMVNLTLDQVVSPDHRVRLVWRFVEGLDLTELLEKIAAVERHPGHPAIDPRILMALWLYATVEGIGSARALDRLCEEHQAYQWLCGGVSVNYHTLADFRVRHRAVLDRLLTRSVAVLEHGGVIELARLAQDGVRVRASAGAASFRRRKTLDECLKTARARVEELVRDIDVNPSLVSQRQRAAQQRAATEREQRVKKALEELEEVEAKKKADEKEKARTSTTDPEARVMKMGDGGFRPAFNVQLATDTKSQVIVGVDVTNCGSDQGQMPPMVEQVEDRYEKCPKEMLVDGGFVKKEAIDAVASKGCTVYAPVPEPKDSTRDPYLPLPEDSPAVGAWRVRMGTPEAKDIYKDRAATAECVNAIARNRGLQRLAVRGLEKVKAIALWFALAHNMMRIAALMPVTAWA